MPAGIYHYLCDAGATFNRTFTYFDPNGNPYNLTGYTARMQVRPSVQSAIVIVELNTSGGSIILGGVAGTIQLLLSAGATGALPEGTYKYDLELTRPDTTIDRPIMGSFTVRGNTTR